MPDLTLDELIENEKQVLSDPIAWVDLPYGTIELRQAGPGYRWKPADPKGAAAGASEYAAHIWDAEALDYAADLATEQCNPPYMYRDPSQGHPGIWAAQEMAKLFSARLRLGRVPEQERSADGVDGAELPPDDEGEGEEGEREGPENPPTPPSPPVENVFCPTGQGGGIDPTCGASGKGGTKALGKGVGQGELLPDYTLTGHRKYQYRINGEKAGDVTVIDKGNGVVRTEKLQVERLHRDKGVAKRMYLDLFDELKQMGVKQVISGQNQSPGGQAVWESLLRDGVPVRRTTNEQGKESYVLDLENYVANVFCKTGQGGGIDPTCSPRVGGAIGSAELAVTQAKTKGEVIRIVKQAERAVVKAAKEDAQDAVTTATTRATEGLDKRAARVVERAFAHAVREYASSTQTNVSGISVDVLERIKVGEGRSASKDELVGMREAVAKYRDQDREFSFGSRAKKYLEEELVSDAYMQRPQARDVAEKAYNAVLEAWPKEPTSVPTENIFCKTGQGGGVDPTCSPKSGGGAGGTPQGGLAPTNPKHEEARVRIASLEEKLQHIAQKEQDYSRRAATEADPKEREMLITEKYKLRGEKDAVAQEAHQIIKDALGPGGQKVDKKTLPNPDAGGGTLLNGESQKARQFLDGLLHNGEVAPVPTSRVFGGRPGYDWDSKKILLPGNTPAEGISHEYGHHIEHTVPGAMQAAQAFHAKRTAGETPVALREKFPQDLYKPTELGRKDDFAKVTGDEKKAYYVGKTYEHGGTEIISMGLELMHKDPVRLAKQDPEYFHFMMQTLGGDNRKQGQ